MTDSREEYVTLRLLKSLGCGLTSFCRRFRGACIAAGAVGLIPTVYLIYCMLTTGFPKPFWGPFGRITTLPGYLIVENLIGRSVALASPEQSYSQLRNGWILMLGTNFVGWFVIFVGVTVVARLVLGSRATKPQ